MGISLTKVLVEIPSSNLHAGRRIATYFNKILISAHLMESGGPMNSDPEL